MGGIARRFPAGITALTTMIKTRCCCAIIERDGKILLAQRQLACGSSRFYGSLPAVSRTRRNPAAGAVSRATRRIEGLTPRPASISPTISATCLARRIHLHAYCLRLTVCARALEHQAWHGVRTPEEGGWVPPRPGSIPLLRGVYGCDQTGTDSC